MKLTSESLESRGWTVVQKTGVFIMPMSKGMADAMKKDIRKKEVLKLIADSRNRLKEYQVKPCSRPNMNISLN